MLSEVTIISTGTRLFLDLLDVLQRQNIRIPRRDQQLIRKAIIELVTIVGRHYDHGDEN